MDKKGSSILYVQQLLSIKEARKCKGGFTMETKYYAAVDMGASSGRVMLGWMENGKMQLQEVHPFQLLNEQKHLFQNQ